jgi:glycosyltransferase involved in cell wall biosynthesis
MEVFELHGFKRYFRNVFISNTPFIWQTGVFNLIFKKYEFYILTGEIAIISNWFILFFAKLLNKKVLLWSHGLYGNESKLMYFFAKLFYGLSYKVLLYGNYSKNILESIGVNAEKLEVIYNSVNYFETKEKLRDAFSSNIYIDQFKNHNPVIIFIGRLQKDKKIELLIDALELLKMSDINYNLVLIGENLDYDFQEINLNIWEFGPCFDEETICNLFYNSDLCVSPGNVGLTAIHALSYGTPVITHDNPKNQMPEFESIIEGFSGSFFHENSSADLALKIKNWINLNKDRNVVRANCFSVIDNKYNPQNQLQILKGILK